MEPTSFLPPEAEALEELALDLRWIWSHAGDALWKAIDPVVWERTKNPYVILQNLSPERMKDLGGNPGFRKRLRRLSEERNDYCCRPGWHGEVHGGRRLKGVAYFSMEFGLGEALPLYAGGLGVLAGDHLKASSDLAVPVVGIGLMYQEGYFRQMLGADGRQEAVYPYNDPTTLPVLPVRCDSGTWLNITIDFPGRPVLFRIWQANVGRVTLYLLDSNNPLNAPSDRCITGKLYGGGKEMRLMQEIALGIGGWRLIEALGLETEVCHLNEGHAAFATIERARCFMEKNGMDFWEALWATRAGNVFTTHTPVAAGFDIYSGEMLLKYGREYAETLGVEPHDMGALGRRDPGNRSEPFNMTYLAMRTCCMVNGVSRLHGNVSRRIFRCLYPEWPEREVPVTHITNGVHVPSWDSPWADEVWTRCCGKERWRGSHKGLTRTIIEDLGDEELWGFRCRERADLVAYARRRLARQMGQRGEGTDAAATMLDEDVLTIGFARRFAEYKRPNLLLHDPERLVRLITDRYRPVQLIVAGKAHPGDDTGKRLVSEWTGFVMRHDVRGRAVFLEDYDISLAQELVQGVDLWLNTPRRPWEACGTSGMKVLANGGLNLSELDGWWAEAYSPEVGWAIGDGSEHREPGWDAVEAGELYRILEEEVVPEFYDRDGAGIPRRWVARIRESMARLTPRFSTNRMMREYVEKMYLPASEALRHRTSKGGLHAKELRRREVTLKRHWHGLRWGNLTVGKERDGWSFELQLYLGEIPPDIVEVQIYADPAGPDEGAVTEIMERRAVACTGEDGYTYFSRLKTKRPATDFTPRVVPSQLHAFIPAELGFVSWYRGGRTIT